MERKVIQVEERPPLLLNIPLSIQHLFAMFGSTVLVPFLFKVNPTTCLFMNGLGTLLYIFITKGKIPSYLGSSFAFISPVLLIMSTSAYNHAQSGFIVFGLLFMLFSLIIHCVGTKWIDVIFPPAAMGAIIAVIGLELAPVAANMAGLTGDNINMVNVAISMFTLAVGVIGSVDFSGFMRIVPILLGVGCGYVFAAIRGIGNFQPVIDAPWFQVPHFYAPVFDINAIMIIAPAALVVLAEHIGHLVVTGNIVDRNLIKDPGLSRSLFADGLSNVISGFAGATPNTTYGENIGVMAATRVYSTLLFPVAAIFAIILGFSPKFGAVIQTIPQPVLGGTSIVVFGLIAVAGARVWVVNKVDFGNSRNLIVAAVILVCALGFNSVGGVGFTFGSVTINLSGLAIAAIAGILLNAILPGNDNEFDAADGSEAASSSNLQV